MNVEVVSSRLRAPNAQSCLDRVIARVEVLADGRSAWRKQPIQLMAERTLGLIAKKQWQEPAI